MSLLNVYVSSVVLLNIALRSVSCYWANFLLGAKS